MEKQYQGKWSPGMLATTAGHSRGMYHKQNPWHLTALSVYVIPARTMARIAVSAPKDMENTIFDYLPTAKYGVQIKHRIDTADNLPINQRSYRVSPDERCIISEKIDKMMKNNIIQLSESP
ncbi:hypothetical protein LAZ67_6003240 [Cordylochernes scorpioides]|uniref:Vitellogenin n=1 Tax=Cordylochernes scorpioides TaxID=51811 RepID=A0ABY6KKT5_9ARAC|nr:hypothetical protein LAZ67_6003240 [Cordylochernes scorpioides]